MPLRGSQPRAACRKDTTLAPADPEAPYDTGTFSAEVWLVRLSAHRSRRWALSQSSVMHSGHPKPCWPPPIPPGQQHKPQSPAVGAASDHRVARPHPAAQHPMLQLYTQALGRGPPGTPTLLLPSMPCLTPSAPAEWSLLAPGPLHRSVPLSGQECDTRMYRAPLGRPRHTGPSPGRSGARQGLSAAGSTWGSQSWHRATTRSQQQTRRKQTPAAAPEPRG